MNDRPLDINTISEVDVLQTVEVVFERMEKEDAQDAILEYVSELIGKSTDWILNSMES